MSEPWEHYENKLKNEHFNPKEFVQQLCKNLDNAQDLYGVKKVVEGIKQTHATELKKNVYKNYGQFIQTSKEITYLEAEMYKLGHLLTEQKALISSLTDDNITSEKIEALDISITEDMSISKIVELVQGAAVLHDIPGRKMIHNGNLIEVGEEERQIRLFLMNDCIMSAAPTKSAWMSEAYKMVHLLELKNITIMDVQDQKLCFKITQYPANMFLYRAETEQKKIEWVSHIKRAQQDLKEAVGDRPGIELKQSRDDMIEGTKLLTKLSVVEQDVTEENSWGHNVLGPDVLGQDVGYPSQQV